MKIHAYIAPLAISLLMAGCLEESSPTRTTSPSPSSSQGPNSPTATPTTETGLEEFASAVLMAFSSVPLNFATNIASLRAQSGNRCISGSFTVNDRNPGNYDEAIEGVLSNCEPVAGGFRENGRFYVNEKQGNESRESFVELGIDNRFVNWVTQFDDGTVTSNAYQGTYLGRRDTQVDERDTDVQFRRESDNGFLLEGSQSTNVTFDIANDTGSISGQLDIDRVLANTTGDCLMAKYYSLSTSTPFRTRMGSDHPEEIPLTGGLINISRSGQSATVSFTDEGYVQVTSGNRSQVFSDAALESLCSHS